MKKFFISLLILSVLFEGCSVLKRKYCKGYYVDFVFKHSSKTLNKGSVNTHTSDSFKLNTNAINSLSHNVELNSFDTLYAYQSASAGNSVTFFKPQKKEIFFEEKKAIHENKSSLKKINPNDRDEQEQNIVKRSLKKMVWWDFVTTFFFTLSYSILYARYSEIMGSGMAALLYVQFLFIPSLILSVIGLIVCVRHFKRIKNNPEASKFQRILGYVLLWISILFTPILILLLINFIIIV